MSFEILPSIKEDEWELFEDNNQRLIRTKMIELPARKYSKHKPAWYIAYFDKTFLEEKSREMQQINGQWYICMAIQVSKFVLHQVDRDFETGRYGFGAQILTEELGDMAIVHVDPKKGIIHVRPLSNDKKCYTLQVKKDAQSDKQMFFDYIVDPWLKVQEHFLDDKDYADYWPAFYFSLHDVANDNCKIFKPTHTKETFFNECYDRKD